MAKNVSKLVSPLRGLNAYATISPREKAKEIKKNSSSPLFPKIKMNKINSKNELKSWSQALDVSSNVSQNGSEVQVLIEKLGYYKVPQNIISTYSELISKNPSKKSDSFVKNEILDLSSGNSILMQTINSYKSWKGSLKTITEMTEFLAKNQGWHKMKDVVNECSSSLSTHVIITLNYAEMVINWKSHLRTGLGLKEPVPFVYEDSEFADEFFRSCDFLLDSPMSESFPVAANDPFLLNITREAPMNKKNTFNYSKEKNKFFININKKVIESSRLVLKELEKTRHKNHDLDYLKTKKLKKIQEFPPIQSTSPTLSLSLSPKARNKGKIESPRDLILPQQVSGKIKQVSVLEVTENTADSIFEKVIDAELQGAIKEVVNEELAFSVFSSFLNIIYMPLSEIANFCLSEAVSEVSNQKAQQLHLSNIIVSIVRNLIEEEIYRLDLKSLCESEIKAQINTQFMKVNNDETRKRLTRISINLDTERLTDMVYHSLIDRFIEEDWIFQMISNSIQVVQRKSVTLPALINNKPVEEVEDFALEVFTPGVHSPNEVRSEESSEYSADSVFHEEQSPAKLYLSTKFDIKSASFEPFNELITDIDSRVQAYLENLPDSASYLTSFSDIKTEREKNMNTKYYWVVVNRNITGLCCYSTNGKTNIVHHVSCIYLKCLEDLLINLVSLAKFKGAVLLQFRRPVMKEKPVLSYLKKSKFAAVESSGLQEFKLTTCKDEDSLTSFCLNSVCAIETSSASPFNFKICGEMAQIGNRHSIISLILSFYKENEELVAYFDETPVRLQQDLNELLEILFSLNFRSYSLVSIKSNPLDLFEISSSLSFGQVFSKLNPSAFSVIDLNFAVNSCFFTSHSLQGVKFKYLVFGSNNIKIRKEDKTKMFVVPTNDPEISVFFIKSPSIKKELDQGLKLGKTDLFYNIDNLIKALQDEEEFSGDLWVPCFSKTCSMVVPWVEGYRVNTESSSFVIANCVESMRVNMEYLGEANETVSFPVKKRFVIDDDFIFGVYSRQVMSSLDSLFYAVLVSKEDYLVSK